MHIKCLNFQKEASNLHLYSLGWMQQGWANGGLRVKVDLPRGFVNKALLERSHGHVCVFSHQGRFPATTAGSCGGDRASWHAQPETVTIWPFQKQGLQTPAWACKFRHYTVHFSGGGDSLFKSRL